MLLTILLVIGAMYLLANGVSVRTPPFGNDGRAYLDHLNEVQEKFADLRLPHCSRCGHAASITTARFCTRCGSCALLPPVQPY
jgi:hypothetical protein